MKKVLVVIVVIIAITSCVTSEIHYTTSDGNKLRNVKSESFDKEIIEHVYSEKGGCIKFRGKLTSIGEWAFYFNHSLINITIPNSVVSVGKAAFAYCPNLKSFFGEKASPDNRCLIINDEINAFAPADLTEYTIPDCACIIGDHAFFACDIKRIDIPDCIISIKDYAFAYCGQLEEVVVPEKTISIGNYAFHSCGSIQRVVISDSVLSIGEHAFSSCIALKDLMIGSGVRLIEKSAFACCESLRSVAIPSKVSIMGKQVFYDCIALKDVYCKSITPPMGEKQMFDNAANKLRIRVPRECIENYKSAFYWNKYSNRIVGHDF